MPELRFFDDAQVVTSNRERRPGELVRMRTIVADHYAGDWEWWRVLWTGGPEKGPWTVGVVPATRWEIVTRWAR